MKKLLYWAVVLTAVTGCSESSFDRKVKVNDVACTNCAGLPDNDGDKSPDNADCDDNNSTRYPGAPEICDGLDSDCDGTVDEGCAPNCSVEICDSADNDCDGIADDGINCADRDRDNDGHADNADCAPDDPTRWTDCSDLVDLDGDGYYADPPDALDCDDGNVNVHPGAAEICGNAIDDDCDGTVDEGCVNNCSPEICDNADNDCDGVVDDGCNQGAATAIVRVPARGFRNLCIDVEALREHRDATFTVSAATWEDVHCVSGIQGEEAVFYLVIPTGLKALRFDIDYPDGHNTCEGYGDRARLYTTPMRVEYGGRAYTDAAGQITPFSDSWERDGHTVYGCNAYTNFSAESAPNGREAIYSNP